MSYISFKTWRSRQAITNRSRVQIMSYMSFKTEGMGKIAESQESFDASIDFHMLRRKDIKVT